MDKRTNKTTKSIRRLIFAFLFIILSLKSVLVAAGSAKSASDLTNMINKSGEKETIGRIISDTSLYSELIAKVEQASPEWIQIASRLRAYADAGFASELDSALSLALSKRPALVLDKLDEQYVQGVCSAPFLIDYSDAKAGLKTLERTRSELLKLSADKVAKKTKICLTHIGIQIKKLRHE